MEIFSFSCYIGLFRLQQNDKICDNSAHNSQECGPVHSEETHSAEPLHPRHHPLQPVQLLSHPPVCLLQCQPTYGKYTLQSIITFLSHQTGGDQSQAAPANRDV